MRPAIGGLASALLLLLLCSTAGLCGELKGKVSWIFDGDTLQVEGVGKVRLIGIDSPEAAASERDDYFVKRGIKRQNLRRAAEKALEFNIATVKGKMVNLEFDGQGQDRYGRTLAYVHLPDGRSLNRLLLEQGLALVYRRFDFRQKQDYLAAEESARHQKKGLWKP